MVCCVTAASYMKFDNDGTAKIADFGVSKVEMDTALKEHTTTGTLYYMASELKRYNESSSDKQMCIYDHKVDVYSYGRIINKLRQEHAKEQTHSTYLDTLIKKCTEEEPDDRPEFTDILKDLEKNRHKFPGQAASKK